MGGLGSGELIVLGLVLVMFLGGGYFFYPLVGRIIDGLRRGRSPEEILRDRFGQGEISEDELREMLQALRDSSEL